MPGRQRLRRGVDPAAPLPRGAAQRDLGGLGQRHRLDVLRALGGEPGVARRVLRRDRRGPAGADARLDAFVDALHARARAIPTTSSTARAARRAPGARAAGLAAGPPRRPGRRRRVLRVAAGGRPRARLRDAAARHRLRRDHRARPAAARRRTDGITASPASNRIPSAPSHDALLDRRRLLRHHPPRRVAESGRDA